MTVNRSRQNTRFQNIQIHRKLAEQGWKLASPLPARERLTHPSTGDKPTAARTAVSRTTRLRQRLRHTRGTGRPRPPTCGAQVCEVRRKRSHPELLPADGGFLSHHRGRFCFGANNSTGLESLKRSANSAPRRGRQGQDGRGAGRPWGRTARGSGWPWGRMAVGQDRPVCRTGLGFFTGRGVAAASSLPRKESICL